ncbi:MAG: glycosyltransferase [Sulfuricellaceae bacterium]|nr:glycosyltransferase [Sulfuricellaceae bacterium]
MSWFKKLDLFSWPMTLGRSRNKPQVKESIGNTSSAQRIVCVSHDAGFYGAQLLILHIAQVLKEQLGFHVTTVLLGNGSLRGQFEQIGDVVDFTDPPWRVAATAEVMRARQREIQRLFREGARHAICNTSISGHVVRMLKEEGFQVIALIHELPNLIREFRLESPVKEIGRWADQVVFPAAFVRDRFLPIAGLDPARSVIRPQGLYRSNPHRHAKAEAREHLIAELGLVPTARLVVAAGQGDRRKGMDLFCQVAAQVVRALPDAHFVWIGDDSTELAQDCKAWVQSVGIEGSVHFTGVLQQPDLYLQHIAGADLYLMTSREDPYPSVVLDAMEAGVPVLGFEDAGGFTELLREGAGVLTPYENRGAMAAAVISLLVEPARAAQIGQVGQRIIDERFYFLDYVYDLLQLVGSPHRKVSVVVPNYNYARYLPTRLGTIMAQTYRPYEILFLDDNSSDDSVAVAEAILAKSGLPYRIVSNAINRGCYSQWLSGIEMAKGELVWIAEADDECEPTFLEELVKGFEDPDVVLAYSQSRKIDQDGKVTSGDYLDYTDDLNKTKWCSSYKRVGLDEIKDTLAIKNTIPNASGVLMRKPDFSLIGDRLLQYKNAGDWFSYVHILASGSIYFTPKVLNSHRVHIGGVTRGGNAVRHMSEIIQVQEHVRAHHELTMDTVEKIERMRQFIYEYLGLNATGMQKYQDHPDLKRILDSAGSVVKPAEMNCVNIESQS